MTIDGEPNSSKYRFKFSMSAPLVYPSNSLRMDQESKLNNASLAVIGPTQ
jgi:hypothetical protein